MDEVLLLTILVLSAVKVQKQKNKKKKVMRKYWVKNWLLKREKFSHINLLNELRSEPEDWRNYMRMDEATYLELLQLVSPKIEKQSTVMRQSISPHERLSATLRFLATGRTYKDMQYSAIISQQSLSSIIPETCHAIYESLKKYIKVNCIKNIFFKMFNKIHTVN